MRAGVVQVSGVTVCPLFPGASPEREAIVAWDAFASAPPYDARAKLLEGLAVSDEELGPVGSFFQHRRAIDCNAVIGRKLLASRIYWDYWHTYGLHRQLLAVVGNPSRPLGFLCWTRTDRDAPFTPAHVAELEHVAVCLARTFDRIAQARAGWFGLDAVVLALHAGLPQPCGVFDENGYAVWLNAAAERATGVRSTKTSSGMFPPGPRPKLTAWRTAVERVRGRGSSDPCAVGDLTVRTIERPGHPSLYLVVADSAGATPPSKLGLTVREAEVAELAAQGYAPLNIAARLGCAEGTVRNTLKRIYRKLGVELARVLW